MKAAQVVEAEPTPTAMSPEQTDEAIARARAAAEEAARTPKLPTEPVLEAKKVTRVAEPLKPALAPAPIVAASPSRAPAPAPAAAAPVVAPASAPKKASAPTAPPPAARKSGSSDPLDSRR